MGEAGSGITTQFSMLHEQENSKELMGKTRDYVEPGKVEGAKSDRHQQSMGPTGVEGVSKSEQSKAQSPNPQRARTEGEGQNEIARGSSLLK